MHNDYQPLSCALHDYLEIACLYHYHLHIELTDGSTLDGEARTTETIADKGEFLVVRSSAGEQPLRMDQLLAITPLNTNASFGRVLLAGNRC